MIPITKVCLSILNYITNPNNRFYLLNLNYMNK